MQDIVIKNSTVYNRDGVINSGWLAVKDGIITALGDGEHPAAHTIIDAQRQAVLPGFIDLHAHGALGYDTMQATPEALETMARHYACHGVTGFLAATITGSPEVTLKALTTIAQSTGPVKNGATILGAYLEGPCISAQAKGAHAEHDIRRAEVSEYSAWFETGVIKQITIAPEFPENITLLNECVARGIMPTIGHTTADYECVNRAVSLGAHQSTHTFNAMSGIHHRAPGTAGAVLANDAVVCELIADMVHVHPAIVKLAIRAKGIDGIVLVTDAESGTGLEPGDYTIGGRVLRVTQSGVYLPNGTLAGSVLTMDKALGNAVKAAELTLGQAWPMTSYNAARQLGLEHKKGLLAVGYDADIVIIDSHDYAVAMTLVQGVAVYTKK